jgi:hypothetical protein
MMKKVMFALCFVFGGIVTVAAQETQDTTSNQYRTETQSQYPQDAQAQDQDRERIQATELPDEVKRSLEGEEYRGWLISGAFKSKEGSADQSAMESDTTSADTDANKQPSTNATATEGEEHYIVELKNGAETKTLRFDSKGQKVEGMEDDQNLQNTNQNTEMNTEKGQMEETTPADQSQQADPNATQEADPNATQQADPNATEQPGQSQSTGDQSTQSSGQSTQQSQSGQSTETQTQTDQSKANEPK